MNNYDLKKLQQTELSVLVDFDHFCKENDLQYYLIGGALLGAVRYKKFIPWDNDVDVAMPREDYDRLKIIYSSDKYFLQNSDTDPYFARCIQKLRLNGTEIIEKVCKGVKIHKGIYIDIFPIDYIDNTNLKELKKRARKIRKFMSLRAIKSGYVEGRFSWLKKILKICLPITLKKIDVKIDELCKKENSLQIKYAVLFLHNYPLMKQLHDVNVFGQGTICEFEGYEFIAPSKSDKFLKKVFGVNYMQEPPIEIQKQPHNFLSVRYNIEDK